MTRIPLFLVSLALGLLALAGCNEMKLALHVVKKLSLETEETEPLPAAAEEGGYKLGEPYEIDHVWYFPSYDSNYDMTGVASWYGHPFHGRPTANGERYDMNDVTAAHPTLPLPSRVRVTNLENGRQLVLRVNDRGPFIDGRLIDVSRRAAQLLGFYREGLAEVRVEYLGLDHLEPDVPWPVDSPKTLLANGTPSAATTSHEVASSIGAVERPPVKPVRTAAVHSSRVENNVNGTTIAGSSRSRGLLVEAAVLEERDDADRLSAIVRSLGTVAVEPERRSGRVVYAVRIGPVASDDEAATILAQLNQAGLTESHIIAAGYR